MLVVIVFSFWDPIINFSTDFVCFKIAKHNLKFYSVTVNAGVDVQTMFLAEFLFLPLICVEFHVPSMKGLLVPTILPKVDAAAILFLYVLWKLF